MSVFVAMKDDLISMLKGYRLILIVKDDMTYEKLLSAEQINDLGLMGFALSRDRVIEWLRRGEEAYYCKVHDAGSWWGRRLLRSYVNPILGRRGERVEEVV